MTPHRPDDVVATLLIRCAEERKFVNALKNGDVVDVMYSGALALDVTEAKELKIVRRTSSRGRLGRLAYRLLPVFGSRAIGWQLPAALLAGLLMTIPCFADEQPVVPGKGFTLYAGYQLGGSFTDQTSGQSVRLREGASFGASLDIPLDESSEFQVFYNHQSTEFTPWPYPNSSDQLRLDYLHIGGTYFPDELGHGLYVVGGIGATRLAPDTAGFNPATRISMNIGIGYLLPLSKNVGLRFEARGFATAIGSNASIFCSGGCVALLTGSAVTQGDFLIGVSARFN